MVSKQRLSILLDPTIPGEDIPTSKTENPCIDRSQTARADQSDVSMVSQGDRPIYLAGWRCNLFHFIPVGGGSSPILTSFGNLLLLLFQDLVDAAIPIVFVLHLVIFLNLLLLLPSGVWPG